MTASMAASTVESKPVVGFSFAIVNNIPVRPQESSQHMAQVALIQQVATALGFSKPVNYAASTTYRRKVFTRDEVFLAAVQCAREAGCPLFIANVFDLVRSLGPDATITCFSELDGLDVPIFNVSSGKLWKDISPAERLMAAKERKARSAAHAARVKAGVAKGGTDGSASAKHQPETRKPRRPKLEPIRRAHRLKPIVADIERSLAPGEKLGPARLAKLLNERGVAAPRGGAWTAPSAGRLLKMVRRRIAPTAPNEQIS